MFICPVCHQEFDSEQKVVHHYLACWKENALPHKPKEAPRSQDINKSNGADAMQNFMEGLKKNARSKG